MPNADKCYLNIPFKEYLKRLEFAFRDVEGVDLAALRTLGELEFENYKAIERRINDPACGVASGRGPTSQVILDESDGTNRSSAAGYTSSSFSMQPGELYFVAYSLQRDAGDAPLPLVTHSGGATFDLVHTARFASDDARVSVFRCQPDIFYGPGTVNMTTEGSVTLIWCCWHVIQFTGAYDDRANNGAAAILDSADRGTSAGGNSATVTLSARVLSPDAIFATFGIGATNTTASPGATYNQLALSTVENVVLFSEYKFGDNTAEADASWPGSATSNNAIAIAVRGADS